MEELLDLVAAYRILAEHGVIDAYGHVSLRSPRNPQRYYLARSVAPEIVQESDLIEYDLDSKAIDEGGRESVKERFIHGEIFRARPDVMCVVHNHSPSVVPFSAVEGAKFRPISHMCGFLGDGAARFEIREFAGDATDLLVRNGALGVALAKTLGNGNVVLMRGHGSTVVGPTLKHAVYRAIYTEVNARMLTEALRLGDVEYLSRSEALATMKTNEGQLERPWALWKEAVKTK